MRNKIVGFTLSAMFLTLCVSVDAHQAKEIPQIQSAGASQCAVNWVVAGK